jgi:hypothetical protein
LRQENTSDKEPGPPSKLAAFPAQDHDQARYKYMNEKAEIIPGQILSGPQFNESMRVETVRPNGSNAWVVGLVGMQFERFRGVYAQQE